MQSSKLTEGHGVKKVCIAGAGGFIGSHLAKRLKAEGHWVRAVDWKENEYMAEADFCHEFIKVDLREIENCRLAVAGCEWVFNLAADMGGMGFIQSNHSRILYNSAMISFQMAEAARCADVKRFWYASSACIYPEFKQVSRRADARAEAGERAAPRDQRLARSRPARVAGVCWLAAMQLADRCRGATPPRAPAAPRLTLSPSASRRLAPSAQLKEEVAGLKESDAWPAQPQDAYGLEKLVSEELLIHYSADFGMECRIGRFHNIYGPQVRRRGEGGGQGPQVQWQAEAEMRGRAQAQPPLQLTAHLAPPACPLPAAGHVEGRPREGARRLLPQGAHRKHRV